jgi:NAD(P)-dependent dehydrogenase (short-subunit alcohol dehydrogenase family)
MMTARPALRILVIGCTRGIGRALLQELHQLGHKVGGCGRTEAEINRLKMTIGPPSHFRALDITDEKAVRYWASEILLNLGTAPDLLICNAGLINPVAPFWKLPKADFDRVNEVNITGTANVLRAFLPAMIQRKKGIAVTLSSGLGQRGAEGVSAYCTSKFAIEGLSKAIAEDLKLAKTGVACIPVAPGVIDTDMLRGYLGQAAASKHPGPEAWAKKAAPWLLSLKPDQNGLSLRMSS